jgi:hypothetical protein
MEIKLKVSKGSCQIGEIFDASPNPTGGAGFYY